MDDYETLISTTDSELLKKAWRNEKAAPEILRFEADLVHRSRQLIKLMVNNCKLFQPFVFFMRVCLICTFFFRPFLVKRVLCF